jgi:hypothetical protein
MPPINAAGASWGEDMFWWAQTVIATGLVDTCSILTHVRVVTLIHICAVAACAVESVARST